MSALGREPPQARKWRPVLGPGGWCRTQLHPEEGLGRWPQGKEGLLRLRAGPEALDAGDRPKSRNARPSESLPREHRLMPGDLLALTEDHDLTGAGQYLHLAPHQTVRDGITGGAEAHAAQTIDRADLPRLKWRPQGGQGPKDRALKQQAFGGHG